jgi:hypothetical protein
MARPGQPSLIKFPLTLKQASLDNVQEKNEFLLALSNETGIGESANASK